jgi:hypothetical protein
MLTFFRSLFLSSHIIFYILDPSALISIAPLRDSIFTVPVGYVPPSSYASDPFDN